MSRRRNGERLYAAVLLAFLVGLVALGLLGVPALLVAAIGLVVAALGIALFHARRESAARTRRVPAGAGSRTNTYRACSREAGRSVVGSRLCGAIDMPRRRCDFADEQRGGK